jgi:hypothetical protein
MASVKDGCFQPHTSGESTCSGSAGQTGLLRAWREWIIVKDASLHGGLFDSELRAKFDEHAAEARRLTDERIDALQKHVGDLAEALNEKTAALDAVPAQLAALRDTADAAHAAMRRLGWDGSTYPDEWATACLTSNVHFAVREALGVPAGKPLLPYAHHAAKGMQALAILGWQDGPPVEWATKRAAAEADLRGAFAEAELVGSVQAKLRDALDGLDNWRSWAESFGVCPVGSSVADLQGAIRASWNRLKARNEKLIGLVGVLRSIKQLVAVDLSA